MLRNLALNTITLQDGGLPVSQCQDLLHEESQPFRWGKRLRRRVSMSKPKVPEKVPQQNSTRAEHPFNAGLMTFGSYKGYHRSPSLPTFSWTQTARQLAQTKPRQPNRQKLASEDTTLTGTVLCPFTCTTLLPRFCEVPVQAASFGMLVRNDGSHLLLCPLR